MIKKISVVLVLLIAGAIGYQNCARVNFGQSSPSLGVSSTSTFALTVTGGTLASPVTTFTATSGQTYDFQLSGSASDFTSGLDNAQSFLKKVSGQCSGNSIYQPFTLDLTQSGTEFQFGSNPWNYSSAIADQIGGCVWQICAATNDGNQACVVMTAQANATTTTTTTLLTTTTLPTVTTLPPTTTTSTTLKPTTTTTTMAPTTTTSTTLKPTTTTTTMALTTTTSTTLKPTTTTTTMAPTTTTSTTLKPTTTTTTMAPTTTTSTTLRLPLNIASCCGDGTGFVKVGNAYYGGTEISSSACATTSGCYCNSTFTCCVNTRQPALKNLPMCN